MSKIELRPRISEKHACFTSYTGSCKKLRSPIFFVKHRCFTKYTFQLQTQIHILRIPNCCEACVLHTKSETSTFDIAAASGRNSRRLFFVQVAIPCINQPCSQQEPQQINSHITAHARSLSQGLGDLASPVARDAGHPHLTPTSRPPPSISPLFDTEDAIIGYPDWRCIVTLCFSQK